ncbi:hypothetical protein EVAR_94222_1 [Eumeta japonica]|uniref:Uncharacterized protein n=1 Tax=Eumeta variegata TaxID=151549 RepID=A0A4C1UN02_EUMVA|nr:hypothetical protein EVAR_94222_1 [Eumeta japonica]
MILLLSGAPVKIQPSTVTRTKPSTSVRIERTPTLTAVVVEDIIDRVDCSRTSRYSFRFSISTGCYRVVDLRRDAIALVLFASRSAAAADFENLLRRPAAETGSLGRVRLSVGRSQLADTAGMQPIRAVECIAVTKLHYSLPFWVVFLHLFLTRGNANVTKGEVRARMG